MINVCAGLRALEDGYACSWNISFKLVVGLMSLLGCSLVDIYAKCGSLDWLLGECSTRYHLKMWVTWTAIILGHVKCRQRWRAMELFQQMQQEDM